jgi:cell fate (sporulation/competence/biofilm development) regulator YmcA (YheA/YmcA/DUF963 family)
MRTASETEVFRKAIETSGEESQMHMVLEEMSELAKEVCKSFRFGKKNRLRKVAEEIADVEICLEQLKMIFHIDDDVEMWRLDKTVRLKKKLGMFPDYGGDDPV